MSHAMKSATMDALTADVLSQAMAAARLGQLDRARELATDGLIRGGDAAALNAFLGMIMARGNQLEAAVGYLKLAHASRPGDVTIACNLIAALIDIGDLAGAFAVATHDLATSDGSLRIARYRGFMAQSLELFAESAAAYRYVVAHAPDDFESWNNLGNASQMLGDFDNGVAALRSAIAIDPTAAPARLNLAAALVSAERFDDAEAALRTAIADFPNEARFLHELYVLLKRGPRQEEAVATLEAAARLDPGSAMLQFKLAVEYGIHMRVEDAERAYLNALAADPGLVDAYLGLAIQYEHSNRTDELSPLIARAEAHAVDDGAINFLRALAHRRAGRYADALACLADVPSAIEPERAAHLRASILDKLGDNDAAFAAFEETARLHQANTTDPLQRAAQLRDDLRQEIGMLTSEWVAAWAPALPPASAGPAFLVGFPRSGTTLLDTILMGHPDTTVMEEKPHLINVDTAVGGMSALSMLDDAAIAGAREQYLAYARSEDAWAYGRLLIDKSPLYLHRVPLIHRLFPGARFVLALRHPCDVILSCFMSNFRLNAAMSNFLRLEDAAAFYDLTFQHWERARSLLPINVHTVVYERLIEDIEGETRPLFEFLELDWRHEALDHQRTAKARGLITTASYAQVAEPIYRHAAGRWKRYQKHLEPVLPVLEPWVRKFGYSM